MTTTATGTKGAGEGKRSAVKKKEKSSKSKRRSQIRKHSDSNLIQALRRMYSRAHPRIHQRSDQVQIHNSETADVAAADNM